jgi:UDP-glucose 4-epimerase
MKKAFITGGSGFIGANLANRMIDEGWHVTNYDRRTLNNNQFLNNVSGDMLDFEKLGYFMKDSDVVCHYAATVGNSKSYTHEDYIYELDLQAVKNIIKACESNHVHNIIYASTSDVYGDAEIAEPSCETMKVKPKSPYARAKVEAEKALKEFAAHSRTKVTVLRYSTIYGCGQGNKFLIPAITNNLLLDKPVFLCCDGKQIRNFIYISDAIEGTLKAIQREGSNFEIFNITSSEIFSLLNVAQMLIKLNDNKGEIKYVTFDDVHRDKNLEVIVNVSSPQKAKNLLGFEACTKFNDGLSVIYDYYKNILEKYQVEEYAK